MTIENKGVARGYEKIVSIFIDIDLTSNKFDRDIPESIGNLRGLEFINFAYDKLAGRIPTSLRDLRNLESQDISLNKLSGEIPQQLAYLTFLAFLNVSNNNLTGPIPKGKQFDRFQSNSHERNTGLCGDSLSRKCGNSVGPAQPSLTLEGDDDDSDFPSGIDLLMISFGYASGLIVGAAMGQFLCTRYFKWFV